MRFDFKETQDLLNVVLKLLYTGSEKQQESLPALFCTTHHKAIADMMKWVTILYWAVLYGHG